MFNMIPPVIGVIVIVIIALVVITVIRKIAGAAKDITGVISDVADIAKAVSDSGITKGDILEQPPKSVSGQTTLLLPAINRDFPDLDYEEAKARAQSVLISFLQAVSELDPELLTEGYDELENKLENRIRDLKNSECRETYENIKIHRTEINQYSKKAGRCIITFQSAIEYFYYRTDRDGQIVKGSKEVKTQSKYDVDMIYVQDRDASLDNYQAGMGVSCPNCGAPLKMLGAKKCTYCGTPIVEINIKSWNFSDVREL